MLSGAVDGERLLYLSSYLVVLVFFSFFPSTFTTAIHGEVILEKLLYPMEFIPNLF